MSCFPDNETRINTKTTLVDMMTDKENLMMNLAIKMNDMHTTMIEKSLDNINCLILEIEEDRVLNNGILHWVDIIMYGDMDMLFQLEEELNNTIDRLSEMKHLVDDVTNVYEEKSQRVGNSKATKMREVLSFKASCFNKYTTIVREMKVESLIKYKSDLKSVEKLLFTIEDSYIVGVFPDTELLNETITKYTVLEMNLASLLSKVLSE